MIKLPERMINEIITETKEELNHKSSKIEELNERQRFRLIKNTIEKQIKNLKSSLESVNEKIIDTDNNLRKNKENGANELVIKYQLRIKEEYLEKQTILEERIDIKENEKKYITLIYNKKKVENRVPILECFSENEQSEIIDTFGTYEKALHKSELLQLYNKEQEEKKKLERNAKKKIDSYISKNGIIPSIREFSKLSNESYKYYKNVFGLKYKEFVLNYLGYEEELFIEDKKKRKKGKKTTEELLDDLKNTFNSFYQTHGRYPFISELQELNLYSTTYYCNRFGKSFTKIVRELAGFVDFKFIREKTL